MVYKIRVILNTEEDAIRDIAIDSGSSLEDLHNSITNSFGFTGDQMASFYRSDETWIQGEEHPLFDMGEGAERKIQMSEIKLEEVLREANDKMIYVYDFFNMWSFYVELIETEFDHSNMELPALLFSLGVVPSNAPEIQFESEDLSLDDLSGEEQEGFDEDYGDFSYN
ncbi:plasmid pRiA4b ORF-3 family protein [Lutimonas saemankumensis]|uniref:plasmid pRiA4b ORF-3 family protein n=1 Tax=Lutimonas saemankumensis TaxID=483016 RepID=UPI001CD465C7|nr:plasmid pRiA4b ORF-3 family protein [Lutimonas saemankumensis]MCA0933827.1 plasmid pRiA4b ORF-3 family protein [Lutimonas saemankumensis]